MGHVALYVRAASGRRQGGGRAGGRAERADKPFGLFYLEKSSELLLYDEAVRWILLKFAMFAPERR